MTGLALRFLGAARHVTGSKHLLEIGDTNVLLDCGLVSARNVGNTRIYQVSSTGFRGINLWLDQFWQA